MILIPTSEVKTFLKRSGKINTSRVILPVLEYIKLDCCGDTATMSKTDLNTWCIHQIEAEFKPNQTLLIDERILNAVIANGADEIISISHTDKHITIKSGKANASFAWIDPTTFPDPPSMAQDNGISELPTELRDSIKAATSIVDSSIPNSYSLIYVRYINGVTEIFSTNGATCYLKKFEDRFPKLSISPVNAAMICSFEQVQHYELGNYDFYDCGKTIYGFVKATFTPPNYTPMFSAIDTTDYFEIPKDDLIQFCSLTSSAGNDPTPVIKLNDNGSLGVIFSYDNQDLHISTSLDMLADKNFAISEFKFNPRVLVPIVKAIDSSMLRFTPTGRKGSYYIYGTEESGLITIIAGVA